MTPSHLEVVQGHKEICDATSEPAAVLNQSFRCGKAAPEAC